MIHFLQSRWFSVLAIGVVVFLSVAVWRQQPLNQTIKKRIANLENEISNLNEKNDELVRLEEYYRSDAYLEKEAKLKLNVRRPDESMVFIKGENSTASASAQTANVLPFWQRWLDKIFK